LLIVGEGRCLVEECLKVGIVFGDKELVVDVAEVEERLVAT